MLKTCTCVRTCIHTYTLFKNMKAVSGDPIMKNLRMSHVQPHFLKLAYPSCIILAPFDEHSVLHKLKSSPVYRPVCPAPGYLLFPLLFGLTALPWKSCAFFGKKLLLLCMGEQTDLLRLSNTCSKKRTIVPFWWESFSEGEYLSLSRAASFPSYARAFQAPWISSSALPAHCLQHHI